MLLSMAACDRETGPTLPKLSTDQIYSMDGGFIITRSMLDLPYNQITFPGTHNSFAGPNWDDNCGNQLLTITEQLRRGVRYIELDVDGEGCASHNGWCTKPLEPMLHEIREFARDHPQQIITVRISDLACDRRRKPCGTYTFPGAEVDLFCWVGFPPNIILRCCSPKPEQMEAYEMINWFLEAVGLIFNLVKLFPGMPA